MNTRDSFDQRLVDWLEDGPADAPDQVLETIVAARPSIPQRRAALRVPWRFPLMNGYTRAIAGVAAVVAIAVGAFLVIPRLGSNGVGVGPASPSPTPTPAGTTGSIAGTYIALFQGADPSEIPSGGQQIEMGQWTLMLPGPSATAPNNVAQLQNPQADNPIQLAVTFAAGDLVTFAADPTCPDQTTPTSGTYHYSFSGSSLVLSLAGSDSCGKRIAVLTAHPWTRVK
jgi:hypothetical protein